MEFRRVLFRSNSAVIPDFQCELSCSDTIVRSCHPSPTECVDRATDAEFVALIPGSRSGCEPAVSHIKRTHPANRHSSIVCVAKPRSGHDSTHVSQRRNQAMPPGGMRGISLCTSNIGPCVLGI